MGHKSNKGTDVRAYKLKVNFKNAEEREFWRSTVLESQKYKTALACNINSILCTKTIGDMAEYISDKHEGSKYYQECVSDKNKDRKLFNMFTKSFNSNHRDNIFFRYVECVNPEGYKGNNLLGLSTTKYRRYGYVKSVVANYVTKMSGLKPNVKERFIDESLTKEDMIDQIICEMVKHNNMVPKDFINEIEYLKSKESYSEKRVNRLTILHKFFVENENEVIDVYQRYCAESLSTFNGVNVDQNNMAMTIDLKDSKIIKKDGCKYVLHFETGPQNNKRKYDLDLFGSKQIIRRNSDGTLTELVDICNGHGEDVTFKFEGDDMYVCITVRIDFQKEVKDPSNIVGCDINIKHMLLSTSIPDNGEMKGYVNIYKALCENPEFTKCLTDDEREDYKDMAKIVTFCPLERDGLFSRYCTLREKCENETKDARKEEAFKDTIDMLRAKYSNNSAICNYLNYVKRLRTKIVSYTILKLKYKDMQMKFDNAQGYVDESTARRETMDKRRYENPFGNTPEGIELLIKMNNVARDIIGCRDNIICYAYDVLSNNGYDTVALEGLESSQFEVTKLATPKSLLDYHKLRGTNVSDAKLRLKDLHIVADDYNLIPDSDGNITDICLSNKGELKKCKRLFENILIKVVHFADIKDKFIELGNNGRLNIAIVPSFYTSQINSISHCMYVDEKGKIVDKHKVRNKQEKHINGLNADYNAARNIAYIVSNETIRNEFCKNTDSPAYNTPLYLPRGRKETFILRMKKMGLIEVLNNE